MAKLHCCKCSLACFQFNLLLLIFFSFSLVTIIFTSLSVETKKSISLKLEELSVNTYFNGSTISNDILSQLIQHYKLYYKNAMFGFEVANGALSVIILLISAITTILSLCVDHRDMIIKNKILYFTTYTIAILLCFFMFLITLLSGFNEYFYPSIALLYSIKIEDTTLFFDIQNLHILLLLNIIFSLLSFVITLIHFNVRSYYLSKNNNENKKEQEMSWRPILEDEENNTPISKVQIEIEDDKFME
jgi:hypothetical protein